MQQPHNNHLLRTDRVRDHPLPGEEDVGILGINGGPHHHDGEFHTVLIPKSGDSKYEDEAHGNHEKGVL